MQREKLRTFSLMDYSALSQNFINLIVYLKEPKGELKKIR